MTDFAEQVIDMICNHPDPDKAIEVALAVFTTFFEREGLPVDDLVDRAE